MLKLNHAKIKELPNIILIIVDALRPDYLGCYGATYKATPNIDSLAKDSVIFRNMHSPLYGTDCILTTIFTGLWPRTHGIIHHGTWVPLSIMRYKVGNRYLSVLLKKLGYINLAIDWLGRWHKMGFDYYSGALRLHPNVIGRLPKILRIISYKTRHFLPYDVSRSLYGSWSSVDPADDVSFYALEALKLLKLLKRPFFLAIHFWDTHAPYDPPLKYTKKFRHIKTRYNIHKSLILNRIKNPRHRKIMEHYMYGSNYTDEIIHRYIGAVNYVDEHVGRIISYLKYANLYDNTLIMLCSDHGESLGEHLTYFDHHTLFEEVLRSVFIIKFPWQMYSGK